VSEGWVLDSNVVLDWLVFNDASMHEPAARLRAGHARWLICPAMRVELEDVVTRPAFARRGDFGAALRALFDTRAQLLADPTTDARLRCRDVDDQVFVDLALQHRAALLLTRDRALLELAPQAAARGLRIARPDALAPIR
jgi:predicted nucleic acid-binding protein